MNDSIQEMIDWIEDRLKDVFSLEDLASFMGYSPYYCSFKFHQATGISIRRYILLRRLYVSTEDLAKNRKIIDIALKYSYSSQEAYGRAFKTVFGISPREFQLNHMPVQSFDKLVFNQRRDGFNMNRGAEVNQLKNQKSELFDQDVLNILNGQLMYEEFKSKKLMGDSDYAPFNEAMCVHATTIPIFDAKFVETRAVGHGVAVENYTDKVIKPLTNLNEKNYNYIVLWFGEDMFCQMNLLTLLAFLEQSGYKGRVFLNSFQEDEFKVNQTEITLGCYRSVYEEVLVHHKKPSHDLLPVMYQAINIFLDMQKDNNPVTAYISKNIQLPQSQLLNQLFKLFPTVGYGNTQYIELINKIK